MEGLLDLGFLSEAEATAPAAVFTPEKAGDVIDRYRLLGPLGAGGFGCVWRVEQTEPIHRELALKLVKPGMDSCEIIARFEAERQALALMDHPNIAAVLDAGTTVSGRPYFVMELVKGEPITDYCDHHKLGIAERLALFIPVCQAVQHAHQKSILHRDLKPSNILVAVVDGKPQPKIIDFGIAKALGGDDKDASLLRTRMGVVIGTPRYMSPEQAGSRPDVDTRSDVYSLGIILCEMLTGQSPFPAQPAEVIEALQWVREVDAAKPSTLVQNVTPAVAEAASLRNVDPTRFTRLLRGDLDWITLKALEKDRSLRYESATALARDLQNHLDQKPVSAVAPTWRYQLGKFARRQRVALVAAGLISAALLTGTAMSLWQAARAEQSRVEAEGYYAQAREAVEKYLAKVSNHPRLKTTDFTDLQRELLETAMPFYERMSRYEGDDPKLRTDRAWAVWQLAKIYQQTGQMSKAEVKYHDAIQQQEELVAVSPDNLSLQRDLGYLHNELGFVLRSLDKGAACLPEYEKAVRIEEALVARAPDNADFQHSLGTVMINHAIALDFLKHSVDSQRVYFRAGAVLKELVRKHPNSVAYWGTLGNCLASLGALHSNAKDWKAAEFALTQAVECQEQAFVSDPRDRTYRNQLGVTLSNLGVALFHLGRLEEAETHLRRALGMQQRLVNEFPSMPLYRDSLLDTQRTLSITLSDQGREDEAESLRESTVKDLDRLAAEFPDKKKYADDVLKIYALQASRAFERKQWDVARDRYQRVAAARKDSEPHLKLSQIAVATKDHAAAVKHAVEYARLAPATWLSYDSAALRLREALRLIQADAKLEPARREQLMSECAGHLVQCLQKAVPLGGTGLAFYADGEKAAYLRGRDDFQTLLKAPLTPPKQSPTSFYFDYQFDNPGPRQWSRNGLVWKETAPGGESDTFTVMGPVMVEGVHGSQLEKTGERRLTVFVPDLGTAAPMVLKMKNSDGTWSRINEIKDVK